MSTRGFHVRYADSEICLRRMRTWSVGAVGDPRIRSVGLDAQKLRVDEHIEHRLTDRPLNTAESLRLLGGQAQARHFHELGTHTFEQCVVWHDGHR